MDTCVLRFSILGLLYVYQCHVLRYGLMGFKITSLNWVHGRGVYLRASA
jgi:hypothetical protein